MTYIVVDAEDIETGKTVEAIVDNTEVRIGDTFEENGRKLRRLPALLGARVKDEPFITYRLPLEHHVEDGGFTRAPHYVDGVAAFTSKRERQEYAAQHNDNPANGDRLEWDQ